MSISWTTHVYSLFPEIVFDIISVGFVYYKIIISVKPTRDENKLIIKIG